MLLHEHWIALSSHFLCPVNTTEKTKQTKQHHQQQKIQKTKMECKESAF